MTQEETASGVMQPPMDKATHMWQSLVKSRLGHKGLLDNPDPDARTLWRAVFVDPVDVDGVDGVAGVDALLSCYPLPPAEVLEYVRVGSMSARTAKAAGYALVHPRLQEREGAPKDSDTAFGTLGVREALKRILEAGRGGAPRMLRRLQSTTGWSLHRLLQCWDGGRRAFTKECVGADNLDLIMAVLAETSADEGVSNKEMSDILSWAAGKHWCSDLGARLYCLSRDSGGFEPLKISAVMVASWLSHGATACAEALRKSLLDTSFRTVTAWTWVRWWYTPHSCMAEAFCMYRRPMHETLLREIQQVRQCTLPDKLPRTKEAWDMLWGQHDDGSAPVPPRVLDACLVWAAGRTDAASSVDISDVLARMAPEQVTMFKLRQAIVLLLTPGFGSVEGPHLDHLLVVSATKTDAGEHSHHSLSQEEAQTRAHARQFARVCAVIDAAPDPALRDDLRDFALVVAAATGSVRSFDALLAAGANAARWENAAFVSTVWFPQAPRMGTSVPRSNAYKMRMLYPGWPTSSPEPFIPKFTAAWKDAHSQGLKDDIEAWTFVSGALEVCRRF